jgi:replication initiation and membrane attachment protein DnaB
VTTLIDTRDFIRIQFNDHLKIDLVNDRVFRSGITRITQEGYKIDNVFNILTNKITAIIGRDEPKDVFDVYSIAQSYDFSWREMIDIALKKSVFEIDILADRLQSFPVTLFDKINTDDSKFLLKAKSWISSIAKDILSGADNKLK